MKKILIKTLASLTLLLLCSISFIACKKTGETIDAVTIESKLAGEDSTMWIVPGNMFENESTGCVGIARMLFNSNNNYSYTRGTCTSSGTWYATYTTNRTGQTITIECVEGMKTRRFNLLYSKDNDTFYYLDAVNGLVALKKDRRLMWEETGLSIPSPANRKGMISIEQDGVIYFGLGQDGGGNYLNDIYKFDGNTFDPLPNIDFGFIGARATIKNDSLYIVAGFNSMANTYTYRLSLIKTGDVWDAWKKVQEDGSFQQRSNAVYFTLGDKEVLGLGSSKGDPNFFYRTQLTQPWSSNGLSIKYGMNSDHDYQNALCFPWNGGQFIGGGASTLTGNRTDFMCHATNDGVLKIDPIVNMKTPCNSSFSEGTGIELDKIAVVFGLKIAAVYSDTVYVLNEKVNGNYTWFKYLPAPTAQNNRPIVGESTVFWRVKNSAGNYDTYAGLGAADNKLYKLVIE